MTDEQAPKNVEPEEIEDSEETVAADKIDDETQKEIKDSAEDEIEDVIVEVDVEEIEVSEDDICGYLVDENDNEIGFIILDENGEEQEYFYANEDELEALEQDGSDNTDRLGEGEEVIEMELDEDDIQAYLVDENDNEIGFVILDENGEEQEYYYVEEEKEQPRQSRFSKETYETVAAATDNVNAIYREGSEVVSEFRDAVGDITSNFDFLNNNRNSHRRR